MRSLGVVLLVLAVLSQGAVAKGKGMFRWVDENGQVHYGDRIPPQYANQQREVLNQRGQVKQVLERVKTAAEVAAEAESRARSEAEKKQQDEAKRYDQMLLQTYRNIADLQAKRDERLSALDGSIALSQKAVVAHEKALADLKQRVEATKTQKKPVEPAAQAQIATTELQLIDAVKATKRLRDERTKTSEQFAKDIERFRSLRNEG
jgi:hypothetical protein